VADAAGVPSATPTATPTPFEPLLALAARRARFEAVVRRRYAGVLTAEDAEDVVSDALVAAATACPAEELDGAVAWFTRVVLNRAEDERRRRHGRPRSARGRAAARTSADAPPTRRFVALHECPEAQRLAADGPEPADAVIDRLGRAERRAAIRAALTGMDPLLARVLWQRHAVDDGPASRARAAAALDVSLRRYERLYTRARRAFIEVAATGLS
jgi:DNA-directed RNA polymerase specialized sigma24 family protein